MVKGGTNFRKQSTQRRKKRRCPSRRPQEDVCDPAVVADILVESYVDDGELPGPSHTVNISPEVISVSEKKLSGTSEKISEGTNINKNNSECPTGNRFVDMDILSGVFSIVACPECGNKLKLLETKKQGLSFQLQILCEHGCEWSHSFWTSKKKKKVRNFDVNRRMYYAMRRIGNGYQGLKRFLNLMNHPHPMTETNYGKITNCFNKAVKVVAETIMQDACIEIRGESPEVVDTGVTNDGTWQKRGFTSYNGAVISISILTGKILDAEAMSRFCQRCLYIETLKTTDPNLYERYLNDHDCQINHQGSAPKMEVTGVERIFGRSIEKNRLRYTEYYGDGDTKAFSAVESIYGNEVKVVKQECIGHIQKRVGSRLRKLKKNVSGLGKLGLTDSVIDKLQNYYGMAVRSNVGDLAGMKKAIYAAWCHVSSSEKSNFHVHCPVGPDSWCMFQTDIANGTSLHKHGKGLPPTVIKQVKAVFDDLSTDNLLSKCLHGKTQNQNEAFNGTIWNRIPKTRFVKFKVFELALFDAVAHFNIGILATLLIFDKMGLERGYYTTKGCLDDNKTRIENAKKKSMESVQIRRRILRGARKNMSDKTKKQEGSVYGAGKF